MTPSDLPALNASLNATAMLLMTAGFYFVRQQQVKAHRWCMSGAFLASAFFLVGYLTYHYLTGARTPFLGEGFVRVFYYGMLISHIILAAFIVPLVLTTFILALRGRFERHRAWARWTFPIWYYVSVTGVLIYFFLYQWYPAAA